MKAYAFNAALYCEQCGDEIKAALAGKESEDSNVYPQGPYPNGGGEADCPQHCDSCGEFLENVLTGDGDKYVRDQAAPYDAPDSSWDEIAQRAEQDGKPVLAQWFRFYFAPGQ